MNLVIAYSSDNKYVQHLGVSMTSLFENNKGFENIKVYIIENNVSLDNKNKLNVIAQNYDRQIQYINFNKFANKLRLNIQNNISISSYARLFLSSMLSKDDEKVIYLDCDSVIDGILIKLWTTDISEYYIAGVCDTVSNETKSKIGINSRSIYINAGMILINIKKWREENIEQKFMKFISKYDGRVFHHDQGVINGVLNEKCLILHPRYNAMSIFFTMSRDNIITYYGLNDYYSEIDLKEAIEKPVFIHFTPAFVSRPWIRGCKHPVASLYKKYLDMTPWENTDLYKDNRKIQEKFVSFLYNHLQFKIAYGICNFIFNN